MKSNERSSYTVITTGINIPFWSAVRALNSLVKPIMLIPACPSAGPTGGAGVAAPAGICNLTMLATFFATRQNLLSPCCGHDEAVSFTSPTVC